MIKDTFSIRVLHCMYICALLLHIFNKNIQIHRMCCFIFTWARGWMRVMRCCATIRLVATLLLPISAGAADGAADGAAAVASLAVWAYWSKRCQLVMFWNEIQFSTSSIFLHFLYIFLFGLFGLFGLLGLLCLLCVQVEKLFEARLLVSVMPCISSEIWFVDGNEQHEETNEYTQKKNQEIYLSMMKRSISGHTKCNNNKRRKRIKKKMNKQKCRQVRHKRALFKKSL